MDCEQALRELSQYLDRELDMFSSTQMARHLVKCRTCISLAEFERRLRSLIRRVGQSTPIPTDLRQRLGDLLESS